MSGLQEDILQEEEDGEDDQRGVHAVAAAADQVHRRPRDESEADAVGDVVGERHDDDREQAGERLREVVEMDVRDLADHQKSDQDERRGRGECRDGRENGGEQDGDQEQRGRDVRGQAGPAALGDAGGGFDVARGAYL